MATTETQVTQEAQSTTAPPVTATASSPANRLVWLVDQLLRLLSSVRFGIIMLSLLLLCSMIGMLVMQKDVEGFEQYYANLKPAQRVIYTKLNIFDIYHSRYFTFLLAITALNIILASIDRFPTAWQYIVKPKRSATPRFIQAQMFNQEEHLKGNTEEVAAKIQAAWKNLGFRARLQKDGDRITLFAQKNAWNRLGAYFVHIALMFIFVGGFLTNWYGVGGSMEIVPGETSNSFIKMETTLTGPKLDRVQLPFDIECTDLQQKLIRPEGGLEATNTIDWLSYVTIKDKQNGKDIPLLVHLNNPQDYKGFRLFQSKFTAFGHARSVTVRFEPTAGVTPLAQDTITIPRNGTVAVPGLGNVSYRDFFPDFEMSKQGPRSASPDYNNPAAQLEIVGTDGKPRPAFAFNRELADKFLADAGKSSGSAQKADSGKQKPDAGKARTEDAKNKSAAAASDSDALLVNGYKPVLVDFEKAAMGHTLTVQYDPGRVPAYFGFIFLVLSLCSVFFFAHQRIWAVIEPDDKGSRVFFGGNTNRNRPAFEGRFNSIVEASKS
jgi:cytochrome c biogenesis protein